MSDNSRHPNKNDSAGLVVLSACAIWYAIARTRRWSGSSRGRSRSLARSLAPRPRARAKCSSSVPSFLPSPLRLLPSASVRPSFLPSMVHLEGDGPPRHDGRRQKQREGQFTVASCPPAARARSSVSLHLLSPSVRVSVYAGIVHTAESQGALPRVARALPLRWLLSC